MTKILLTGASGFLGKAIAEHLCEDELVTLGRNIKSDIICDFPNEVPVLPGFDLVIHSAGLAHTVPKTETEKELFFEVNTKGTHHLLKAIDEASFLPRSFVFISTVAVYGKEKGVLINEEESLDASDPYGLSKIQAEQLVQNWCMKNGVICTILRLPLLAGAHPPGNLKAMIKGIDKGYYFNIAGGSAKKSMVLIKDVAKVIPQAAITGGVYNLTDGHHPSFAELSSLISGQLGKTNPLNIPLWIANVFAGAGYVLGNKFPLNYNRLKKITSDLTFDDTKASQLLGWKPTPVLKGFKII